jgi:hypothetical protein
MVETLGPAIANPIRHFIRTPKWYMNNPPHSGRETPEDPSESQSDWKRRLRLFGIDAEADPNDILIQLSERLQDLNGKS